MDEPTVTSYDDEGHPELLHRAAAELRARPLGEGQAEKSIAEFTHKAVADVLEAAGRGLDVGQDLHPEMLEIILRIARHVLRFRNEE